MCFFFFFVVFRLKLNDLKMLQQCCKHNYQRAVGKIGFPSREIDQQ
jgi:hypothetical protein